MTESLEGAKRPAIAVLISTRNRRAILEETLCRLFMSDLPEGGFEVIVVDDGSSDGTGTFLRSVRAPAGIRFSAFSISPSGAGRGFNTAAKKATAEYFLFLGDDAFVPPDLVAGHLHRLRSLADHDVAVSGRVVWSGGLVPSHFLDWLGKGIIHRHPCAGTAGFAPARHFFTLNASIHRSTWERSGGLPEEIPSWSDTVFAFRAAAVGMRLFFDPALVVEHHHGWTESAFSHRRHEDGRIAARILAETPEFAAFVEMPRPGLRRSLMERLSRIVYPAAKVFRIRFLEYWYFAHKTNGAFVRGFKEAGGR